MSSFSKLFKLFLLVVFLPLVPMVLVLSYYQIHLKNNILETHLNLAEIVSSSFSQHMEDLSWRLSFHQQITEALSQRKDPTARLQEAMAENPDFLMLAVLSKDGKERYRVGPASLLKEIPALDLSQDPELPAISAAAQLSVSNFEVMNGLPISEFVYPLSNGDYLYGIISFFGFLARVQELRIGNTGRIYVVSQAGEVYANKYQYTPAFNARTLAQAFASKSRVINNLKSPQETYVGAWAPTPILGAYITVLQRKKEAFRGIYHTNIILLLFLITIGVLAYFGALTFAEQLGEPIAALSHAADEVSHGNLDVQVDEEIGWGEFKQLIADFNKMTVDLKDYQRLQLQAHISQMKESVFRSVAHDLRAPLMGLQCYLHTLRHGTIPPEKQKEYLDLMDQAAKNLSLLLEDVLNVARIESGVVDPKKESVEIGPFVQQIVDILSPLAKEKGLDLSTQIEADTFWVDPKLFLRVVQNLLANAIKFTDKGFIKIHAWQEGDEDLLSVQDSGIGIAAEELEEIFEKYHQVNVSKPGYGLGLFISRQIVLAHGGTLEVTSTPGEGSTFTVRLRKENV